MFQNALSALSIKEPRQEFWEDRPSWPHDAPGYVFAGRAVLLLGAKRFGSSWDDEAPQSQLKFELPATLSIHTPLQSIVAGCEILRRIHEPYRARSSYGFFGSGSGPDFPTREEWAIAHAESKKEAEEAWSKFRPFAAVSYELAESAKQGKLKTALRPLQGGALEPQEWHFWNLESGWLRLDTCRVDTASPFEYVRSNSGTHWIYVEEKSLDTLLTGRVEDATRVPQDFEPRQERKRRAGRKGKYDWVLYCAELHRKYATTPMPDSDYDVEDDMADWCQENFGDMPASSQQRERIATFRLCLSMVVGRD